MDILSSSELLDAAEEHRVCVGNAVGKLNLLVLLECVMERQVIIADDGSGKVVL